MKKDFLADNWKDFLPCPVYDRRSAYNDLYEKTWEIARAHVKSIPGMPQDPYMDEAFCDSQIWIWDSCFMSLFCKFAHEVFPGVETLKNFYDVLYEGKSLPAIIPTENEPSWTRTTPGVEAKIKIHLADNPPLFSWSEYENALLSGDAEHVKKLLYDDGYLQKHFFWFENLKEKKQLPNVLNDTCLISEEIGYKWEGGRSGMDNTPRGRTAEKADRDRPNNPDMYWLDAVCQQALSAKAISALYGLCGDDEEAEKWRGIYRKKADTVNSFYWDEEDGFYYDINSKNNRFLKVKTIASFWTLTAGIATKERAAALVEKIADPAFFGGEVPLVSLSRSDADFSPSGRYWRGALWLPTAYAALKGLSQYGYRRQAHDCALRIVEHMYRTYRDHSPHTVWECYAPDSPAPATAADGKRIVRPDFCGWSALGPISIYIEFVLGFYAINAFTKTVEWYIPDGEEGRIGIKNLRFGEIVTDVVANGNECFVFSNQAYTLLINGKRHEINAGENRFDI